jgi:tRNA(adenine34) deaminase
MAKKNGSGNPLWANLPYLSFDSRFTFENTLFSTSHFVILAVALVMPSGYGSILIMGFFDIVIMDGLDHHIFMGMALEEAEAAYQAQEVPVGAVLVDVQGNVLARAHNAPITHSDPTAHAEILVLRKAAKALQNYRLPGSICYTTLEPCLMCLGAMLWARVNILVYGAADARAGAGGTVLDLSAVPQFNHRIQVIGGVRADECALLLQRFFRERRGGEM